MDAFTFNRAINLNNHPDPTSLEQAQFSLPFCLAVVALEGPRLFYPCQLIFWGALTSRLSLERLAFTMIPRWKLSSRLEQGHDWLSILRKGSFPNKCSTRGAIPQTLFRPKS